MVLTKKLIGFLVAVIIVVFEITFIVKYYLPHSINLKIARNGIYMDNEHDPGLPSSMRINNEKKRTYFHGSQVGNTSSTKPNDTSELSYLSSSCSQLNFSVVSPLLEPNFVIKSSDLFLLVMIPSGIATSPFTARRNVIRSTWASRGLTSFLGTTWAHSWKRVFILGKSEKKLNNEIIQEADNFDDISVFNTLDNYNNLIIKTMSAFHWALNRVNPRFILKADDDVYIRLPYLISWLQEFGTKKFYGGDVKPDGTRVFRSDNKNFVAKDCLDLEFYPSYCSGPFYVLSSEALRSMFRSIHKFPAFPVEDAYIGLLAHDNKISPVKIPGFEFHGNLHGYGRCRWAWAMAIGHDLDDLQFAFIHQKLQETSKLPTAYLQCLVRDSPVFVFVAVVVSIAVLFLYLVFMCR